jgi:two-component system phosphate regulon sensor histidine kinase PhoR
MKTPPLQTEAASQTENTKPPLDASMLDGLSDPVFLVDPKHVIVDCNRAAQQLLGEDALSTKLDELLDSKHILGAVDASLGGAPSTRSEVFLPFPIGRYYELNIWRLPDLKSTGPAWAMLVLHDITETKKTSQMRADFVANVSHELRSPLSSLLGFIETLRGPARNDAEATERFLEIMESEAKRMTRLINDLLALSKLETEEHIRPEKSVDIGTILAQVEDILLVRAKSRHMKIIVERPKSLPLVLGDADELTQVFQNLMANAISYGRPETPIQVTATPGIVPGTKNPGVSIAIHNKGEGIPAEEIPRLTERFYRADKGRSRSMGGTGLGLAIVKHIVARHRGHLEIESTLGEDTRFSVSLPCAEA